MSLPQQLTSVQNPRVKAAVHLRDRRQRDKQQRIIIDGAREIARALAGGIAVLEAFYCPAICGTSDARKAVDALTVSAAEIFEVTEPVYAKLAFGARGDGVVAVAAMPRCDLVALPLRGKTLLAVVEGVEKPGNVGAVLRSADGAGVDAVLLADPQTDPFNPNAIRASLGTVFSLPLAVAGAGEIRDALLAAGMRIVAARVEGSTPYTEIDFRPPTAIVLGSEAEGLSPLWSAEEIVAVSLPMRGVADSLNVSAAAAVLFYEARRQRS